MRTRSPARDRVLGGLAHVAHRAVGRGDLDAVHRAVRRPPWSPHGGVDLALEAEGDEGGGEELVHALDAEAAAVAPGAAGVLAQPVAQDADGGMRDSTTSTGLFRAVEPAKMIIAGLAVEGRPRARCRPR